MAEVAGLVIGAVALAGTFKDCVDLLSYISAAQSVGRDYELLNTKLDVERLQLLFWAERVGLAAGHFEHDQRLDDPNIADAVSRVLYGVHLLLSDGNTLQQRYGLAVAPSDKSEVTRTSLSIADEPMRRFAQRFAALSVRIQDTQQSTAVVKKIRWVIRDKEKFEELIQQLSYFIRKLNELIPEVGGSTSNMIVWDLNNVSTIGSLKQLREVSASYAPQMVQMTDDALAKKLELRILRRLWYRRMDDRRDNVAPAHAKTLGWALCPPHPDFEWDSLADWLQSGSGIYWLSGKAGSGKSTLMKYLYGLPKTRSLLEKWARDKDKKKRIRLCLGSFFLWNLGSDEQKSYEGFSRAILYQILNQETAFISSMLPKMWLEAQTIDEDEELDLPSFGEISQALQALRQMTDLTQYYCFFIDGLDEFSGNYADGIAIINSLAACPNIKVLVSSRPIPACTQAFTRSPKLRLQDLTRDDIAAYVNDTLNANAYFGTLLQSQKHTTIKIVSDIVGKASGVFLWVVLACRSILDGCAAYDSPAELLQRIDELPPELHDLFQLMLSKIERRYQVQAAKMLRVCYQSRISARIGRIYTLSFAILEEMGLDASKFPANRVDITKFQDIRTKCEILEGRLRSRCCGLLEVVPLKYNNPEVCLCGLEGSRHNSLVDSSIEFIHRTVFEFLNDQGTWDLPSLQIRDPLFEPNSALAATDLYMMQFTRKFVADGHKFAFDYLICLVGAYKASYPGLSDLILWFHEILKDVDVFGPVQRKGTTTTAKFSGMLYGKEDTPAKLPSATKIHDCIWMSDIQFSCLLAVELGMTDFLSTMPVFNALKEEWKRPLLYHATRRPLLKSLISFLWPHDVSAPFVQSLLSSGHDPNEEFIIETKQATTPWAEVINEGLAFTDDLVVTADIFRSFIQAGAHLRDSDIEKLNQEIQHWTTTKADSLDLVQRKNLQRICDTISPLVEKHTPT